MRTRGAIAKLSALLLALAVATVGLLSRAGATGSGPLKRDLQAHHPFAAPAVAQVRTPAAVPDLPELPDHPEVALPAPEPVMPHAIGAPSVAPGARDCIRRIACSLARGPPSAAI